MKLNWGTGIVIAMLAYMIFILSFVVKAFTKNEYDHHLISEEYYKDEINFQQEINAKIKADNLSENVKFVKTTEGIEITFPAEFSDKLVNGKIIMLRLNTEKFDIKRELKLTNNKMLIRKELLLEGSYYVKVFWNIDKENYLFKDNFYY